MGYGMRQQAVELALKVDPSLARELARQSDDRDETKRLWLMIARNAAANGSSSQDGKEIVARVVKVLKDCGPDILSIEDVSDVPSDSPILNYSSCFLPTNSLSL